MAMPWICISTNAKVKQRLGRLNVTEAGREADKQRNEEADTQLRYSRCAASRKVRR